MTTTAATLATHPSPLSIALADAVRDVRRRLRDPVAPVVVVTPSEANGVLARQQLALAADFIRVDFASPERLVRELAGPGLAARGLRSEPDGWLQATVGAWLEAHGKQLGRLGAVLVQPGWLRALAAAIAALEAGGVDADELERIDAADHTERVFALARLLRVVADRRRTDHLFSMADLCAAARDRAGPGGRWAGAVVLGDRLLAPRVYDVLAAWLAVRPHAEVRPHPWHRLAPARNGLRAAARDVTLDVAPATGGGHLAALGVGSGPVAPDDSVILARTPDDVRELAEAVRQVASAVQDGVPLDRIAVVLPDPAQVEVLRAHLAQAGIPATWLVGSALAETPAGGFLLQALALATGADTVSDWYELLRQPGLRLRTAVSTEVTVGQGRWRRILAACGASGGADRIVAAVADWADGARPDDQLAAANLARAVRAVEEAVRPLRALGTLGDHGARWQAFLRRFWVASPDHEQVSALLRGWGAGGLGVPLTLEAARDLAVSALKAATALSGTLSDPAIRVTSPMGLLGGAFERVVVTGLVDGRFPRRPAEDPVLPDSLIERIDRALGTALRRSEDVAAFEARRFAAVVSSCTGSLWLSCPATELVEERPLLPSPFALDAVSVQLGRPATHADLRRAQRVHGSRARPWVDDPDHAIDPHEHRIAWTARDRAAGLAAIARHATGRRLIRLHLDLARADVTPRIDPASIAVPGLDGAPIDSWDLAGLLRDPGTFLVSTVLGVRAVRRFGGRPDPTEPRFVEDQVRIALATALDSDAGDGDLASAFLTAWDAQLARWRRHRPEVGDDAVRVARTLARLLFDGMAAGDAAPSGRLVQAEGRIDPHLPWVSRVNPVWRDGDTLAELRSSYKPSRTSLARDADRLVLSALTLDGVTDLRVCVVSDGEAVGGPLEPERVAILDRLHRVTDAVRAGAFPWSGDAPARFGVRFASETGRDGLGPRPEAGR